MIDWNYWKGKYVFVKLNSGGVYSGKIIEVDDSKPPLIWIVMIDKFGKKVQFVHSEIQKIVEEGKKNG
jgi:ribosome maturation factor RimP